MRSYKAKEIMMRGAQRLSDRTIGKRPELMHTVSSRIAQTRIIDSQMIPVLPNTSSLQNGAGGFKFLLGYSAIGGGDVLG